MQNDALERAKARQATRDASGQMHVEGSIYEGMEACLVRGGRTVAHVVSYADAVEIAAALTTTAAPAEREEVARGWKCNNCQTVFTSTQQERRPNDNNGGPVCPYCKANGQYTYPYALHEGDPCKGCGIAHDDVPAGPCILAKLQPSDRADQREAVSEGGWVRVPVEPTEAIIDAMEAVDHPNNHAAFYCDLYAAMLAAAANAEDKS